MKRTFIRYATVAKVLADAHVSDEAIRQTELAIMRGEGDVISGTAGLRKIRCAAEGRGKSGGVRILFADYPDAGRCHWLVAFPKNVKENLSKGEQNSMRALKIALDAAVEANRG